MAESLVLLPTYNERENLPRVLSRLAALEEVDVLVVDDASPDGTGELAEAMRRDFDCLSVLHRIEKDGLGRAYVSGISEALKRGYNRIVTMDADLSHDPADVPRLLEALERCDAAIGSRLCQGGGVIDWPLWRRWLSRGGSLYARTLLGLAVRDATSGFRAYRAEALAAIDLESIQSNGFAFQVELLRRILDLPGACALELPIRFLNRRRGRSKLTLGIVAEAVREILRLRLRKPGSAARWRRPPAGTRNEALVSVIIPLRPGAPKPPAFDALESSRFPFECCEVILTRGECPSRQRNLAALQAAGEFLVFLDDDSAPEAGLISTYLETFNREPNAKAIGGPAIFSASGFRQRLCAAVLCEPLVTGRSASRFSVRGALRPSDERELILANLAVRRSAFLAAGGFDEALYPNEENLFLERLRERGDRVLHQPGAVVMRPAPRAGSELLLKVFRYGRGRAAQAKRHVSAVSAMRIGAALAGPSSLVAGLAAVPWTALPLVALGVFLIAYYSAVSIRISLREGVRLGALAPLVALAVHGAYAAGIIAGLLCPLRHREAAVSVEKCRLGVWISANSDSSSNGRGG
jgi:dolichol-phosphate mannosyltransferase